jgi:hypothetical protein
MMIFALVSGGLLFGFFVGTMNVGGIDISHFLFADDTLIFGGANPRPTTPFGVHVLMF